MTHEKLRSLTLAALDELDTLERYEQLLEIAQEQLHCLDNELDNRLDMLLDLYLSNASCHIEELRTYLKDIQKIGISLRRENCA